MFKCLVVLFQLNIPNEVNVPFIDSIGTESIAKRNLSMTNQQKRGCINIFQNTNVFSYTVLFHVISNVKAFLSLFLHRLPSGPVVEKRSAAVQAARDVGAPVDTN